VAGAVAFQLSIISMILLAIVVAAFFRRGSPHHLDGLSVFHDGFLPCHSSASIWGQIKTQSRKV
jgi:hypothetical protein